MAVTKGVIAMAGSGTRLGSITKSIPKEMMLVGDRAAGQYIFEEMIVSGITSILGVIRSDKKVIMDHLNGIPGITSLAQLLWCLQRPVYGNGVPALDASVFVGNDPFVFAFADDLVRADGPFTANLIRRFEETGHPVVGCMRVAKEDVSRYGILDLIPGTNQIRGIVEKPAEELAPSTLAMFGRMVLTPDIISVLKTTPQGKGDELWLTDALSRYISEGGVLIAEELTDGRWFDTGKPSLHGIAHIEYLLGSEQYGEEIANYIRERSKKL